MNFLKVLWLHVYARGLLLIQIPLASTMVFLDAPKANATGPEPTEQTSEANNSELNNAELSNAEPLDLPSSQPHSSAPKSFSLWQSLTSFTQLTYQHLGKISRLQPYRTKYAIHIDGISAPLFSLTANSVPSDSWAGLSVNAIAPSGWQHRSTKRLKQWKQPEIAVIAVNTTDMGRSLQNIGAEGLDGDTALPSNKQSSSGAWAHLCFSAFSPEQGKPAAKQVYQLVVNQHVVAEFPTVARANLAAKRVRRWVRQKTFAPTALEVRMQNDKVLGVGNGRTFFEVDKVISQILGQNQDTIAIAWLNNLRIALDTDPLSLVDAQTKLYGLEATGQSLEGIASWYGPYFHGRQTASGEYFNEGELTAAHPSLPFGTYLKVTNLENDRSVVVRVNDRGPYIGERSLDLSRNAAQCLGSEDTGVVPYHAVIMESVDSNDLAQASLP